MTKMLIATSSDVAIAYFPKKDHTEGLPFGVVFTRCTARKESDEISLLYAYAAAERQPDR